MKTAPAGAAYCAFRLAVVSDGYDTVLDFDDVVCQSQVHANAIEAGSIGADHIVAGSIETVHLAASSVTADKIDVENLEAVAVSTGAVTRR